jgi:LysM repeat protein
VSSKKTTPEKPAEEVKSTPKKRAQWPVAISWGATALVVIVLLLVLFNGVPFLKPDEPAAIESNPTVASMPLPTLQSINSANVIEVSRQANLDTTIPEGIRQSIIKYTIVEGDSIFGLAKKFNLKPESILWANYTYFYDDPTTALSIGAVLTIPPTDGVLYIWKSGDDLAKIADKYDASETQIVSWPSNHLDITDPVISPDAFVMIPGGSRELKSWIQTIAYAPRSGATRVIAGPGGCQAPSSGYIGSTGFMWPVGNHFLSGFDFSSYHLGIDIAAAEGTPVYAADSGTVIYAGWNDTGYGNMVMIDHNNGYSTLYGHLSAISVTCGSNVLQGNPIGLAGSTGRSTGAHVHFEVRLNGAFVNPWYVLP